MTGKHEMKFWHGLLRTYHGLGEGEGVLAKHHHANRETARVREYWARFEENYERSFLHKTFFGEMLDLALDHGSDALVKRLAVDYFTYSARDCLRKIADRRSLLMALAVAPLVPRRALKAALK